MPIMGRAKASIFSSKPARATIQAVQVVPMLVPRITATALASDISPAPTKASTMSDTAELDWSTAVVVTPTISPLSRVPVARRIRLRSERPASSLTVSSSMYMPNRNMPSPARNCHWSNSAHMIRPSG